MFPIFHTQLFAYQIRQARCYYTFQEKADFSAYHQVSTKFDQHFAIFKTLHVCQVFDIDDYMFEKSTNSGSLNTSQKRRSCPCNYKAWGCKKEGRTRVDSCPCSRLENRWPRFQPSRAGESAFEAERLNNFSREALGKSKRGRAVFRISAGGRARGRARLSGTYHHQGLFKMPICLTFWKPVLGHTRSDLCEKLETHVSATLQQNSVFMLLLQMECGQWGRAPRPPRGAA